MQVKTQRISRHTKAYYPSLPSFSHSKPWETKSEIKVTDAWDRTFSKLYVGLCLSRGPYFKSFSDQSAMVSTLLTTTVDGTSRTLATVEYINPDQPTRSAIVFKGPHTEVVKPLLGYSPSKPEENRAFNARVYSQIFRCKLSEEYAQKSTK